MKPPGTNFPWLGIPLLTALAIGIGLLCAADALAQAAEPKMGEVLPIPAPKQEPITEMDWRKVPPPKRFAVKPPQGAPNVVIILMDQAGYADPATMGGPIRTPTMDKLAQDGLTYTNFHVNALCSPSRVALLTGRNSHQNSMAGVAGTNTAYPGDTGMRPPTISTIGTMLQSWGYVTGYFGKNNEVPENEVNVSGPFDRWPTRSGFDKFYGYIAGEQSMFYPSLIDGTTFIGMPREPSYHFNTDLTNKAVAWIQATRSLTPDRPFLLYYSQSASHPPHTPPTGLARQGPVQGQIRRRLGYLARKDAGAADQDGHRRARHQACRQSGAREEVGHAVGRREEGLCPADGSLCDADRAADYEVGRLVQGIEDLGELDNTLFIYIFGDNGGSIVGDLNGLRRVVRTQWCARGRALSAVPPERIRRAGLLPQLRHRLGHGRPTPATWASLSPTAAATLRAWSCTGPRASRPRARSAGNITT